MVETKADGSQGCYLDYNGVLSDGFRDVEAEGAF